MTEEKTSQPIIENFKGGPTGKEECLKLKVSPDITVYATILKAYDTDKKQEVFSGVQLGFSNEMGIDSDTVERLDLSKMSEKDVPKVLEAMGTLVKMGATPKKVVEIVSDIDQRK